MVFGHGKSALVTGASSGIGRALALALAREGLDVLLVGRDKGRLEQVMREAGACARFLVADLATQEGIDHVAAFGPNQLDVLVHSAGYYVRTTVASTSLAEWCKSDGINLHAPMLLTAAFLPRLIAAQRQVVFINSSAGLSSGTHGVAAYSASKHALKAAADCLRQEVNAAGVRVLSIFPGRTDTPMQSRILADEGHTPDSETLIDANDIAAMVLAAVKISRTAEVTDIVIRPRRPMKREGSGA